jgi:hypothetical protein
MEYLAKLKNTFINPEHLSLTELVSNVETENMVVTMSPQKVTSATSCIKTEGVCEVGSDVYTDVEFFRPFNDHHQDNGTVFNKIDMCALQGSKDILKIILQTPLHDKDILRNRQNILKDIAYKSEDFDPLSKNERDMLWVFEELDQNLKDMYDMVFFKFCMFKPLNKYPHAITTHNIYRIICSPLIGIMSPILYVIVPFMIITWKLKLKIPFKMYIRVMLSTLMSGELFNTGGSNYNMFRVISCVFSIVFYFQGILNSFELSKTLYKISKHLVEKVNNIVGFLKTAMSLIKTHWKPSMHDMFISSDDILSLEQEEAYVNQLDVIPFSMRSNHGQQLHTYMTLDKSVIKSILLKTYLMESLGTVRKFKESYNLCYTQFIDGSPALKLKECFHPCLDYDKVVKNDIFLDHEKPNAILTGPNAGGKSTFVKSLLINALLAQTVGISVASNAEVTPFAVISSQINIPDCKGYESLFEAEMYRCKNKLDLLKKFTGDQKCLFVMDEIFNSTNPIEGIAGAYAIAKKISEHANCILVFTTHYVYLTKLHKTGRFGNLKMNVDRTTDGEISYPYKLSKGVSKQYIALDLLKKNGFDEDIITQAVSIKDRLVAPSRV